MDESTFVCSVCKTETHYMDTLIIGEARVCLECCSSEYQRLTAELAQARAERVDALNRLGAGQIEYDSLYASLLDCQNERGDTEQMTAAYAEEVAEAEEDIERQRRTIWALVVAGRAIHRTLWQALDQYEINDRGIVRDMRQHVIGLNIEQAKQSGQQAGE